MKKLILLFAVAFNLNSNEFLTGSLVDYSGLIKMPNARFNNEGKVSFNYSRYDPYGKYVFQFSPYDWFEGALFYTDINSLGYPDFERGPGGMQSQKDKGFSLKARLFKEGECYGLDYAFCEYLPNVAVGLVDFAGTSLTASEYVVASKSFGRFDLTAGLGWGALGSTDNIGGNPLSILTDKFDQRGSGYSLGLMGGVPGVSTWFRGTASVFGGVEYVIPKAKFYPLNSKIKLEYDSIDHELADFCRECEGDRFESLDSPISLGYEVIVNKNLNFGLYYENMSQLAFRWQAGFNFAKKKDPVLLNTQGDYSDFEYKVYLSLLEDLNSNGILVQKAHYDEKEKTLYINYAQSLYNNEDDARLVVEDYVRGKYSFIKNVVTVPQFGPYVLLAQNTDVTFDWDKKFEDGYIANNKIQDFKPIIKYPVFTYGFRPGFKTHVGSVNKFAFRELSLNVNFVALFNRHLEFNTLYTYPLTDDYKKLNYFPETTRLEPVRVLIQQYLKQGKEGFEFAQLDYVRGFKNGHYVFASAGHFELMFGGLRLEYLYKPYNSKFAIGFDTARVRQRAFDKSLSGFREYETTTSNINFYAREPFFKLNLKLSYGKYLAKDVGYTVDLSRSFDNGSRMGAFFTRTDVSFEDFGEGSFDKGIYVMIPVDFFTLFRSKNYRAAGVVGTGYRPLTRDGGAKIAMNRELYFMVEQSSIFD